MGERKGQNHYYPPDFDYKKHKSLAGYHGQHPLRERAKKIHMGILVIRFEMPYNIWCDGCNNHIGMGVRYNAEKSKVGNYYTTPIYKFRMKCHLCDQYFEIKTDPASHDYVIISGARRKEQRWDPKENGQIVPEDKATQKKLATDAMYKLEHGVQDKTKNKKSVPGLAQIADIQSRSKDDYMMNKLARSKFRAEKKALKEYADEDARLLQKSSLDMELVEESGDDIRMAQLLKFKALKSYDEKQKEKRTAIHNSSIFGSMTTPAGSKSSHVASGGSFGLGSITSSRKSASDLGIIKNSKPKLSSGVPGEQLSNDSEASSSKGTSMEYLSNDSRQRAVCTPASPVTSSTTCGVPSTATSGNVTNASALLSLQNCYDSSSSDNDNDAPV